MLIHLYQFLSIFANSYRFKQSLSILSIYHKISDWLAPPKCGFRPNDYESHDIAILELEREVEPSNGKSSPAVGPICLPEPGEVQSQFVTISSPHQGTEPSPKLKYTKINCVVEVEFNF